MDIHTDPVYSRTGYSVTSYFWSAFVEVRKTAVNAASDGFGSNFSGAAFFLRHQLVGILFHNRTLKWTESGWSLLTMTPDPF